MSKWDRKNGVPETVTSIPLVDPHALSDNPSIGELVRDATTQVSTLVRAEVELAKAEITRDVKRGLTGSVFFIVAGVVLLYSTFFMFFFLAELLDTWLWRWAAFLVVFLLMLAVTALFAFLGYRKVRRIRGPQQTIESVKETTAALTPGLQKFAGGGPTAAPTTPAVTTKARPAVASAPRPTAPAPKPATAPTPKPATTPTPKPATTTAVTTAPVVVVTEQPTVLADEPTVQHEATAYSAETVYDEPEAYSEDPVHYEPVTYTEDTVVFATDDTVTYATDETVALTEGDTVVYGEETVYSDAPTGPIPPISVAGEDATDDPTAAIYAETGLPVTPEHEDRPGDTSDR